MVISVEARVSARNASMSPSVTSFVSAIEYRDLVSEERIEGGHSATQH
jgi:hypothetical protein